MPFDIQLTPINNFSFQLNFDRIVATNTLTILRKQPVNRIKKPYPTSSDYIEFIKIAAPTVLASRGFKTQKKLASSLVGLDSPQNKWHV